jgi:hypothetical protein
MKHGFKVGDHVEWELGSEPALGTIKKTVAPPSATAPEKK